MPDFNKLSFKRFVPSALRAPSGGARSCYDCAVLERRVRRWTHDLRLRGLSIVESSSGPYGVARLQVEVLNELDVAVDISRAWCDVASGSIRCWIKAGRSRTIHCTLDDSHKSIVEVAGERYRGLPAFTARLLELLQTCVTITAVHVAYGTRDDELGVHGIVARLGGYRPTYIEEPAASDNAADMRAYAQGYETLDTSSRTARRHRLSFYPIVAASIERNTARVCRAMGRVAARPAPRDEEDEEDDGAEDSPCDKDSGTDNECESDRSFIDDEAIEDGSHSESESESDSDSDSERHRGVKSGWQPGLRKRKAAASSSSSRPREKQPRDRSPKRPRPKLQPKATAHSESDLRAMDSPLQLQIRRKLEERDQARAQAALDKAQCRADGDESMLREAKAAKAPDEEKEEQREEEQEREEEEGEEEEEEEEEEEKRELGCAPKRPKKDASART